MLWHCSPLISLKCFVEVVDECSHVHVVGRVNVNSHATRTRRALSTHGHNSSTCIHCLSFLEPVTSSLFNYSSSVHRGSRHFANLGHLVRSQCSYSRD